MGTLSRGAFTQHRQSEYKFPRVGAFLNGFPHQIVLAGFLVSALGLASGSNRASPTVTIQQVHEVLQGAAGEFEIKIDAGVRSGPITLRINSDVGTGRATFEDGLTEKVITESGGVYVRGVTSSDLPGAMTLTAWLEGANMPAATCFFDVIAPAPEPRIFLDGIDVTGTQQSVVVGQRVQLTVILHPSVPIEKQEWRIGKKGEYTGGFLHTPLLGGPQPTVLEGSTTAFYWISPGYNRTVSYHLRLTNGVTATAAVTFDVDGPSSTQVDVDSERVVMDPAALNSSVLGMMGSGISFRARYFLPEGVAKNFIWVQLIQSDAITVDNNGVRLHCVPKTQPISSVGAGLDTTYPYDTHNPTMDNPRIRLASDTQEYSRVLHARMFLLWTSGLSNSIPVPLGFVDWSFSGEVALKDAATNAWELKSGYVGPNNPVMPFKRAPIYPFWTRLVPYTEILTCN